MKGANKYEKFEMVVVNRREIEGAYYNPRKISDRAAKKIKSFLKSPEGGLLGPVIWNTRTKRLVGGHQRLNALDALHRGKPYKLTVAAVEMDDVSEVKANVFLNNPSAQGEWDIEKLQALPDLIPDLEFTELGFDLEELDILGLSFLGETEGEGVVVEGESEVSAEEKRSQYYRDTNARSRDRSEVSNRDGDGVSYQRSDFTLTFIFPSSEAKRACVEALGYPGATRLNSQVLSDLLDG